MKTAILFAGQGSQKVGMGKDLYDQNETFRKVIDSINLDFDVKKLMFEGPMEELTLTRHTQPCMAAFAAGVIAVLKEAGVKADYYAGLSLGEYSALHAANVIKQEDFIPLVAFRGKAMEDSAKGVECGMSAVMGLDSDVLSKICEEVSATGKYVTVSNYNCTGQYVICGEKAAIEAAEAAAKEAGAKRCMPLNVSGPFHTKYMKKAGDALQEYMKNVEFGQMDTPVLFNTTGKMLQDGEDIKEILVQQVQSSIHMEDIIKELETLGVDTVIEVGPGKTLSGFVKRTTTGITSYTIETAEDLDAVLKLF